MKKDYRPLLQKRPDTIILHVGTNNCVNEFSRVVSVKRIKLAINFINKIRSL